MPKETKAAEEQAKEKKGGRRNESTPTETHEKKESHVPPKIDFSTFIYSLFTTARLQLGEMPNPYTQKYEKDLSLASETIDIIALLKDKTKGNLTKEEEKLIEDLLYDLRMTYVRERDLEKKKSKE